MQVYGLTGGIGSGKSTVAAMLEEYGIPVVSADELSRMVVAPGSVGLADVVQAFGAEVLDDRGELDRKKIGRVVFTSPERRKELEAILHPRIRERYEQVLDALEKAGHPVMVYEVPLLFEKKLEQQDEMAGVILVTASADTRIARVKARDALTTEDVLARMRAQMPEEEKRRRANYIIHNEGHLDDLRVEVEHLISRYLRLPPNRSFGAAPSGPISVVASADESDIDTLSPEEADAVETLEPEEAGPDPHEEPTAETPRAEIESQMQARAAPTAPNPVVAPPPPVGGASGSAGGPAPAKGNELEVELVRDTGRAAKPIPPPPNPIGPPNAPNPIGPPNPIRPAPAPAPRKKPPRPRTGTIRQISVPDVKPPPATGGDPSEEPS